MHACLGIDANTLKKVVMRTFWKRIHPEDIEQWLVALNELMNFTLNDVSIDKRDKISYTWN